MERVAKALARNDTPHKGWGDHSGTSQDVYRSLARAAIEAMREPTDLMGNGLPQGYRAGSHSATQIWRAMIDAALAEAPE